VIALISSTLFSLFLLTIFGVFITKTLKIPSNFVEKLLIGLVVSNTLTTCISLFFPINIIIASTFVVLGLFLLMYIREEIKIYALSISTNTYTLLFSLSFILIAFLLSIRNPSNYDTGLYHLQSIKWIEQFSVVPGLANLHGRFGFNPNIFTFFALTSFKDLFKQEIFSVNFTLFSIVAFYFIKRIYSLFKQQEVSNLFFVFFFIFLIIIRLSNLSSPSPDFSSTVIALFVFARMIDLTYQKGNLELKNYFPILILSIYLVTIKLAAIPILLLFVFVFVKYKSELRKSIWLIPILCIIVAPWLARNIITTGWLVYPFPSLDLFSFDWKVPLENVIREKESVTGWARSPGKGYREVLEMDFVDWIPIWWQKRMGSVHGVIFVLSIVLPLIIFIGQILKKLTVDLFTNAVIISSFLGVVFWFLLAPNWRFGEYFILVAAMSPLLALKSSKRPTLTPKFLFTVILICLLAYYTLENAFFGILLMFPLLFFKRYINSSNKPKIIFGLLLSLTFGNYVFRNYSSIKNVAYKVLYSNAIITPTRIRVPSDVDFKTYNISGFDIYVPTNGDRCFDQDIPCTPHPKSTLVLRENTLKAGFKHINK
jgi:hypothetical protein